MTSFDSLETAEQLSRIKKLARRALPLYGLPFVSEIKLLNYSENATFLVITPMSEKRVLRINRPGYHPRSHIASELAWVQALQRDTDIITATPYAGLDGEHVQHIWHPDVPEPRNCVLMDFLPGHEPDASNRFEAFALLGTITAKLHRHVEGWKPSEPIQRKRWDYDAMIGGTNLWGDWREGPDLDAKGIQLLEETAEVIAAKTTQLPETKKTWGLIHADLRTPNLLIQSGQVAVIDFDDTGYSWFIYDLAAALSFIETDPNLESFINVWLEAYQKVRPLSQQEIELIPTFIMLRRMLLLAWIGSHSDTAQAAEVKDGFTSDTLEMAKTYLQSGSIF